MCSAWEIQLHHTQVSRCQARGVSLPIGYIIDNPRLKMYQQKTLVPNQGREPMNTHAVPPWFLLKADTSIEYGQRIWIILARWLTGGEPGFPTSHSLDHPDVQCTAPEGFSACWSAPARTIPGVADSSRQAYSFPSWPFGLELLGKLCHNLSDWSTDKVSPSAEWLDTLTKWSLDAISIKTPTCNHRENKVTGPALNREAEICNQNHICKCRY